VHGTSLAVRTWPFALAALVACHGRAEPPGTSPTPTVHDDRAEPAVAPAGPEFPAWARSLELKRTVGVRLEPGDDAKRIGTIAIDTRVTWTRTASGKGCDKAWIEIAPRGWICGDYVAPSRKPAYGQEVPHLDRGEIVPGTYGKVTAAGSVTYVIERPESERAPRRKSSKDHPMRLVEDKPVVGSLNVRRWDELEIDGRAYWKISQKDNEFVLKSAVTRHVPSPYGGARMSDDTELAMPVAFVWPRGGMQQAYTYAKPTGGALRELAARTPLAVRELASDKDGKPIAVRIGDGEWMSSADVRVFAPAAAPALLLPNERWIDIDLDSQILVAFEGELPVYATLVSSGGKDTPTETGVYRMWLKESEADMKGLNGEDPYSVATVPWTQFFSPEKGLALHTAYWHDQFGRPRSHGCVNLAPRDARWLYFWSDPQVPAGWTMTAGVVEAPGSIVRIRSAADPSPEWKGYAKKVLEARQQNAPVQ
jgi:hypothetical protein